LRHTIRLNNRKILRGFYASLGLTDAQCRAAIVAVDKLDKVGPERVAADLVEKAGLDKDKAGQIVELTGVRASAEEATSRLESLGINHPEFTQGREEIGALLSLLGTEARSRVTVDLSLARGLDYYTGAIFEVVLPDFPEFGSVCSGGRYDDLASQFISKKLPGVGMSVGLTRIMELIFSRKLLEAGKKTTARALVTVYSEPDRRGAQSLADRLRTAGINTEVFYKSPKLGKQIEYAEAKGIEFVFFQTPEGKVQVKDLRTKTQVDISDIDAWTKSVTQRT
jgi:histidyl-tRNA synthetase